MKERSPYILVPTRVGMILITVANQKGGVACPHTRGDDPGLRRYRNNV